MTPEQAYALVARSADSGRLAQAYVVSAPPRGEGGAFVRRVLARLLCREENPPCGLCRRCLSVEKGTHPDVHLLEPQLKSRVIGVDAMREFLWEINTTSFDGGWKAGVIVSADRLNPASANAFLKTLEEPPEQTVLFLLTETPSMLMPTILSRCQRIVIESDSGPGTSEQDSRDLIAILAGAGATGGVTGAFGRADRLTSFMKERKAAIEKEEKQEARDDSDEDVDKETLDARIGARYREWRHGIFRAMLHWYRDIFLLVCGGDEAYLCFPEDRDILKAAAEGCSLRRAQEQIRAVEAAVVQLERNLSETLTCENLFFKLI